MTQRPLEITWKVQGPYAGATRAGASCASRRGLTILEVLISIGVATIGLLGALALIPLATHLAGQGLDADAQASLGRSAVPMFEVFGMNRPDRWLYADGTTVQDSANHSFSPQIPPMHGFVIDSRFVNRHGTATVGTTRNAIVFPYTIDTQANPVSGTNYSGNEIGRRLHRITLSNVTSTAHADTLFTTRDDLVFEPNRSSEDVPLPIFDYGVGPDGEWGQDTVDDDGDGITDNVSEAGFAGSDDIILRRQARGEASWIAMVVPGIVGLGPDGEWGAANFDDDANGTTDEVSEYLAPSSDDHANQVYTLWIIVFSERNLSFDTTTESERVATVSAFFGGGDVRLEADEASGGKLSDIEVNEGDWIMLTRMMAISSSTPTSLQPTDILQPVFSWYRVIRSADAQSQDSNGDGSLEHIRDVTLEGPAWDPDLTPTPIKNHNLSGSNYGTQAVIVPDVAAVYQKTIKLDLSD